MKKINLLFTAILLLCCVGTVKAEEVTIDGIKYDVVTKEKHAIVINGGNCSGDIVIPSEITHNNVTHSVTSIEDDAFYKCSGLTSITIPNSVTSIEDGAFSYCEMLTSITIPNSVTSIGKGAFYACYELTSVTIGNSVTSIGNSAFDGCYGLTSITIPNSVTSIGDGAFNNTAWYNNQPEGVIYAGNVLYEYKGAMPSNTSVVVKDGTLGIAGGAFSSHSGLTSIKIPNSVTNIGERAFSICPGLTSIEIPNSVTSIGDDAFIGTAWYNNQPEGVVYAGNVLYKYKGTMLSNTSVVVKDGTLGIAGGAFSGCYELTSIKIPNSVTSIGERAFNGCYGLTSITIPNSVTSIGDYAFWVCSGLTSIVIEVGNQKYDSRENCNAIIETKSNTLIAGCMNTVIPNSVTSIGDYAFWGCSGLTSITIPNGVTSIGAGAFINCEMLTSIAIPNSVTSIGDYAFENCSGLTGITIPNSVTSIGDRAFDGCSGLTSITIPNSVTSIGDYAFWVCSGLTSIVIEVGNQKYDSRENCNAIIETKSNTLIAGCMNTVIPNSVTNIGNGAFSYCSGLTSVEIPKSVTSIGDYAFYNCSGLTSITIPNSVTSIGEGAFSFLNNLTDVYCLATNVPSTSSYAFYNSYPENITLHVPAEAINSYKTTEPWSNFGNIVEITNTGIIDIPAKAILVTSNNGTINITCSLEGESVELYTSDAMFIESTTIENGCATIDSGLSKGDIAIVKIGEKSIKIIVD